MKKAMNVLFWTAVIIISFAAVYSIYNRFKPETEVRRLPPQNVSSGSAAGPETEREYPTAFNFELDDMNGNKIRLSDYNGKVVAVNFWATWCPYCVEEMPELEKAAQKLKEGGDAVLLTIDVQESPDEVKKFIAAKKLSLPVLMDYSGEVSSKYNVSFPRHILSTGMGPSMAIYSAQPMKALFYPLLRKSSRLGI
jgi:peroxiredoxin